jgi:hypothetical protein
VSYLDDFLAKGDNAPRTPPAEQRRNLANVKAREEEANLYDPHYHAPYGKGSAVAFTPTRKEHP